MAAVLLIAGSGLLDGLDLTLASRKQTLMVGEPVRVDLTWSAKSSVRVLASRAQIVVVDPAGAVRPWSEATNGTICEAEGEIAVEPRSPLVTSYVLAATGRVRMTNPLEHDITLAFPVAGHYRMRAQYSDGRNAAESNWVEIEVVPPAGDDAKVYEVIRRKPWIVTPYVRLFGASEAAAVIAEHPRSPYLARSALLLWEQRIAEASFAAPDPEPLTAPVGGSVPAVLDELADAAIDGPFDEDRLVLLAAWAGRTGWHDRAAQAQRTLLARYPHGAPANHVLRGSILDYDSR